MKTTSIQRIAIGLLVFVFTTGSASAAVNVTVYARAVDNGNNIGGYYTDGNTITADGNHVSVGTSSNGTYWTGVYVIQLPDLQGETFTNARFSVGIYTKNGSTGNADIIGLRISNSNAVSAADFNNAGTTLFSDFLVDGTHGNGSTVSRENDTTFNNWLSTNYVVGNYAVIGIRLQTPPTGNQVRWLINDSDADAPRIVFNPIPEPATYALIFGGLAFGFVMLRRRFKA